MPHSISANTRCPLCHGTVVTHFYRLTDTPVSAASVFADAKQARAVARGEIDLAACEQCGFAFNRSFDPSLGEVATQYESTQAASPHFNAYAAASARALVTRHGLKSKTVLEVGCGDGAFLLHLKNAGVRRAIGIDPLTSIDDVQRKRIAGIELIPRLFNDELLELDADALICRHTLEHIPQVHEFLRLLQKWAARASNRIVLVDLPDAERIFAEHAFWDIYYEHCNYFTARTLRRAFELAGFRVVALNHEFHGQYLTLEAVVDSHLKVQGPTDCAAEHTLYRSFAHDVRASLDRCDAALAQLRRSPDPLIVWQGGSKTVGFLSALKCPERIDGAVDVNPRRQGIFLPGTALPVYPPEHLKVLQPHHVILMNPAYHQEVAAELISLGLSSQIHIIDDLLQPIPHDAPQAPS